MTAAEIAALPERVAVHPLNPRAVRHTKALAAAVGCIHLGVHWVRVEPGQDSTAYHRHCAEEEFIYILSGRGMATIGGESMEIGPGDFMGFPPNSPPHKMSNPFEADLVYLMGGTNLDYDLCEYPEAGQRLYRVGDRRTYRPL
jgi:uncharacterized cupin superfamily protein